MSTTLIIIIVTSIISIWAWSNPEKQKALLMNPYQIVHNNQYYRLVTSGFLHADYVHLIFNMLTLFFFGGIVEAYFNNLSEYGTLLYIIMYIVGIVVSDLSTVVKYKHSPHYNALGASGAVSAVVFSSILFNPLNELCLYGLLCLPGFIFGAIYILYSYYQGKRMSDNINHDAHLYGAAFGIVFTIAVWPGVIPHFIDQLSQFSLF
ncbi:rhomboid family intramembrane serine protease [Marivirga sp. S37H4]|uniref:Rhomboid family intramembrane serine protease n=1 Tax=Marivirga aurantiaca TaxID=2802615 RepID=A0A934WV30_9BACT|nr:rhomboid family intramembrane serine protease [Marivirga aurantiaca]MBK6263490.1 rhomboid family intramembrane serine protease [Marivirga aurantiaca]